jgi:branched-chain amino acid aminotransferase
MEHLPLITKENVYSRRNDQVRPWQKDYLAMYSSLWGGVTRDPDLMMIPMDDHLVHRGDGVFDVMRCLRGKIYQMEAHLQRLERSAAAISLELPADYERIRQLIQETVIVGNDPDCVIRVVVSRGPGSFTTNPFDCPSSQLYVNVVRFKNMPDAYYRDGIRMITSHVPIKKSYFATIKSCNYLPNVLMKMEAVQAGVSYSVALDEEGNLAEGSTENVGIVDRDGVLKFPGFERTLSGITVTRIVQLAGQLVEDGTITDVKFTSIPQEEAYHAGEMLLTGTSLGVVPVVRYDDRTVGTGKPGPVHARLSLLLWRDMTENDELLTGLDWASAQVERGSA